MRSPTKSNVLMKTARAGLVLIASALLAVACGDDGGGGDGGLDGSFDDGGGGASGSAGQGGSGGSGGRPPIPPARLSDCAKLELEHDGSACTSVCSSISCDCDPFPASYIACHPDRGCLTGIDCDVACEMDLGDVVGCAGSHVPCEEDRACSGGRCARLPSGTSGECTSGGSGATCADDGDCMDGSCVAADSDGRRTC